MNPTERAMHVGDTIDLRHESMQVEIDKVFELAWEYLKDTGQQAQFNKWLTTKHPEVK